MQEVEEIWHTPFWQVPPEHATPLARLVIGLQVLVAVLQPPPVWHCVVGVGQVVEQPDVMQSQLLLHWQPPEATGMLHLSHLAPPVPGRQLQLLSHLQPPDMAGRLHLSQTPPEGGGVPPPPLMTMSAQFLKISGGGPPV